MSARMRWSVALISLALLGPWSRGQDGKGPDAAPAAPPKADVPAATVNGQVIPELAVYRALSKANPKDYDGTRKEILNYLVDNVLIDQYLVQLKIQVESKDIDTKLEQIRTEANKKDSAGFEKILKNLVLTEDDLRKEMTCALRWDRFVEQQSTEKTLKEMFARNLNMFDGTQMQARHILLKHDSAGAKEMQAKAAELKKQIEEQAAQEVAKLPDEEKEKERPKKLLAVFGKFAQEKSSCPSKENGGDLGWFPRAGAMVEPFARAAFALKPYQLSDPVATEFGYHLILATDTKPGKDVKYEEVKPFVQEIYSERLREAVIAAMRPQSKIVFPTK